MDMELSKNEQLISALLIHAKAIITAQKIRKSGDTLTDVEKRFARISELVSNTLAHATSQGLHPEEPIVGEEYQAALDEMTELSASFYHSTAFIGAIEKTTAQTLDRIAGERKLRGRLREWKNLPKRLRRPALQRISDLFFHSANDVIGTELLRPNVSLMSKERVTTPNGTPRVIYGQYNPVFFAGGHTIEINKHPDAAFDNALFTAYVTIHEDVHAAEEAVCRTSPNISKLKKTFAHDTEMWRARRDFAANIPSRMYEPYRAQHHERLAFSIEKPVIEGLKAIL